MMTDVQVSVKNITFHGLETSQQHNNNNNNNNNNFICTLHQSNIYCF